MATRGRIGIKLSDGSILSIYHHWDSYPQWLGVNLVKNFNSFQAKLNSSMVVTCQHVTLSTSWESEPLKQEIIQPDGSSKFEYIKDNEGQWVYTKVASEPGPQYYSSRGEDCPPRLDPDLFEYLSKGEEFKTCF